MLAGCTRRNTRGSTRNGTSHLIIRREFKPLLPDIWPRVLTETEAFVEDFRFTGKYALHATL